MPVPFLLLLLDVLRYECWVIDMEEGERKRPSQELVVEGNEGETGVKR